MKGIALALVVLAAGCKSTPSHEPDFGVVPMDMSTAKLTPVTLSSADTLTSCIAVDSQNVYWVDNGAVPPSGSDLSRPTANVLGVSKSGGTAIQLATNADPSSCVVSDGSAVYFTSDDGASIVQVTSSGKNTVLVSQQHVLPESRPRLFVDDGYVYWISDIYGPMDAHNETNALVRFPTSGSGTVETLFVGIAGSPGGVAVAGANAYYSDLSGMYIRPLSGGAATAIGVSTLHPNVFAIDAVGGHIALVETNGTALGDVAVMGLDGTGRVVVSQKLASPLALDSSGVYASQTNLVRFDLTQANTTEIANVSARAIALDSASVYFTDGAAIYRQAKSNQ